MRIELYFSDLTKDAQDRLMKCAGISDPKEANWDMDIHPITYIDFESEDCGDNQDNNSLKQGISKTLHGLGISSGRIGYWYIFSAIEILCDKNKEIIDIDIYGELMKKFNKATNTNIKRAISETITGGFHIADESLVLKMFGRSLCGYPKPLQFLRTVAEYVRLNY